MPAFEPKSALDLGAVALPPAAHELRRARGRAAAAAAISSKFLLRWNGKHVFNPTNFGIVAAMLATGRVWVSPAQWGNAAFFGFLLACAGLLVVHRAARSDVTFAFLATYLALVFGRSAWLGEPLAIPLHRLQSGALLLFSFFMISDPKTTPDSRAGRILFGGLVASGAACDPVPPLPHERSALVARPLLALRSGHRPAPARKALRLGRERGRRPAIRERRPR